MVLICFWDKIKKKNWMLYPIDNLTIDNCLSHAFLNFVPKVYQRLRSELAGNHNALMRVATICFILVYVTFLCWFTLQVAFLLCAVSLLVVIEARPNPDSAGHAPLPGPGLSYGTLPILWPILCLGGIIIYQLGTSSFQTWLYKHGNYTFNGHNRLSYLLYRKWSLEAWTF